MTHIKRNKIIFKTDFYIVTEQANNTYTAKKENGRKIITVSIDPFNGQTVQRATRSTGKL